MERLPNNPPDVVANTTPTPTTATTPTTAPASPITKGATPPIVTSTSMPDDRVSPTIITTDVKIDIEPPNSSGLPTTEPPHPSSCRSSEEWLYEKKVKFLPSSPKDLDIVKNIRKVFISRDDQESYRVTSECGDGLFETAQGEWEGNPWTRLLCHHNRKSAAQASLLVLKDRGQRGVLKLEFGQSRAVSCCQTLRYVAMTAHFRSPKAEDPLCVVFKDRGCCFYSCCTSEVTYESVPQADAAHPFTVKTKKQWRNRAEFMVKHSDGSILAFIDKEKKFYTLTMGENLKPTMKVNLIAFVIAMDVMDRKDSSRLNCYMRPSTYVTILFLLMLFFMIGAFLFHFITAMVLAWPNSRGRGGEMLCADDVHIAQDDPMLQINGTRWICGMSSSSSRTPALSRQDSAKIYVEILRLQREIRQKEEEEAAKQKAAFEKDVGKTFLSKVMAKRRARTAAAAAEQASLLPPPGDDGGESGSSGGCGADKPLLPPLTLNTVNNNTQNYSSECQAQGTGNRRNLDIALQIEPIRASQPIPPLSDSRIYNIPPEPVSTPLIVCPPGFKGLKFVNSFTLKFTPPECCGGPRNAEVHAKDQDKCLCFGRIGSESEVFLQKEKEDKEMEEILGFRYDVLTAEWTISFPELETVAYMVRPKPASKVSATQIYEIFSAEGSSNYFNLGVEVEKSGNARNPDTIFRILNSNLATVGTIILLSNYKAASVTIDDSLWPSQKAVILAIGLYLSWDVVQEVRRKAAWVQVLVCSGILLIILLGLTAAYIYFLRKDD